MNQGLQQTTSSSKLGCNQDTTAEYPRKNKSQQLTLVQDNQHSIIRSSSKQPRARLLAKIHSLSHIINKIQRNKCYNHHYNLFYIPATLMITYFLSFYENQKGLLCYKLYQIFLQRVKEVGLECPQQFSQNQLRGYIMICLNYKKDKQAILRCFQQFMTRHEKRMKGTMPVYYLYFLMVAQMDERLPKDATVKDSIAMIKQTQAAFKQFRDKSL